MDLANCVRVYGVFGDPQRAVAADATGRNPDLRSPAVMLDQAAATADIRLEADAVGDNADLIFQVGGLVVGYH